jgi:hypothetical protein
MDDAPYFACICTEEELEGQLRKCDASEFHIIRDTQRGILRVHDRGAIILDASHAVEGAWFVRLDRAYYRHPFEAATGDAPPGRP